MQLPIHRLHAICDPVGDKTAYAKAYTTPQPYRGYFSPAANDFSSFVSNVGVIRSASCTFDLQTHVGPCDEASAAIQSQLIGHVPPQDGVISFESQLIGGRATTIHHQYSVLVELYRGLRAKRTLCA